MNVLHKPSNTLLVCTITCSLVGCGGGGSDSSTAQDNSSPAQSAGVDLQQAIAGGVYLDSTGKRMLAFDGSGNGTVYTNTPDVNSDKKYKAAAITWSIDGVNLTVATSTGQEILQASADGGMLTTTGNPASYTKTKPLSVALLDGKHLSEIIATGNECTARTLSFSGSTLTVREACGGAFNQIDLAMEQVSGLQGVIQATGSFGGYGLSYQIALQDGDVSKQSTLVIRAVREGALANASSNTLLDSALKGVDASPSMQVGSFTSTSEPLMDTAGLGAEPGFTASTRTGCELFNQHYYTCPADSDLAKLLPTSCVYTAPIWMVKTGGIACLLEGDNPKEAYLFGHDGKAKFGVSVYTDNNPTLTP